MFSLPSLLLLLTMVLYLANFTVSRTNFDTIVWSVIYSSFPLLWLIFFADSFSDPTEHVKVLKNRSWRFSFYKCSWGA